MQNEILPLNNLAHIGDAVWEVFVRDFVITKTSNSKKMHQMTTDRVNANFQKEMLDSIESYLDENEKDILRRARNLSIPVARRSIQNAYRYATAFEVLIGYWYLYEKERLKFFYDLFLQTKYFN